MVPSMEKGKDDRDGLVRVTTQFGQRVDGGSGDLEGVGEWRAVGDGGDRLVVAQPRPVLGDADGDQVVLGPVGRGQDMSRCDPRHIMLGGDATVENHQTQQPRRHACHDTAPRNRVLGVCWGLGSSLRSSPAQPAGEGRRLA